MIAISRLFARHFGQLLADFQFPSFWIGITIARSLTIDRLQKSLTCYESPAGPFLAFSKSSRYASMDTIRALVA